MATPHLTTRSAYSLVYALIYMVVILLVATTAFENVEGKRLHYQDIERAAQVKLNARSAMESGYIAIKNHELGYETAGARLYLANQNQVGKWTTLEDLTQAGYDQCIPQVLEHIGDGCSKWKVLARQQMNSYVPEGGAASSYLYTPIPNTGDAWTDTVCIKHFEVARSPDHPCNFNKIRFGQAVSIPLYYTDSAGNTVTPFEGSTADFYLRIRTPCAAVDGKIPVECDNSERYQLDEDNPDLAPVSGKDQSQGVILWSLVGTNILEDTCTDPSDFSTCEKDEETLFVNVGTKRERGIFGDFIQREQDANTEITEKMINQGQSYSFIDNTVLTSDSSGNPFNSTGYRSISDFVHEVGRDFDLLSLRVEVVTQLINGDSFADSPFVPYLEWQMLTDLSPSEAVAADQVLITGYGYEKGQKGVYSYPFRKVWDRSKELLPNFTIAN